MTAEAVVLNTRGVAIAADSAIFIDNLNRVYNTEEKIFQLSPRHSVGIMYYGSGSFMHIDWELVLIEFSKILEDRVLDTLEDYVNEFLIFLRDFEYNISKNASYVDTQEAIFGDIVKYYFTRIKETYESHFSKFSKKENLSAEQKTDSLKIYLRRIRKLLEKEKSVSLYDGEILVKIYQEIIITTIQNVFGDYYINDALKEEASKIINYIFSKAEEYSWIHIDSFWLYTVFSHIECCPGIVFTGYGSKELFPSVIDFYIIGKFGDELYHTKPNKAELSQERKSIIGTYAQSDVMQTLIRGIDPYLENFIFGQLEKLNKGLIKIAGKEYKEKIEEKKEKFMDKIKNHKDDNYFLPLTKMIASVSVNNLAEIAEALVTLTSLRRHISTVKETVGGPTDVAIITKESGFVWVKRKMLNRMLAEQR